MKPFLSYSLGPSPFARRVGLKRDSGDRLHPAATTPDHPRLRTPPTLHPRVSEIRGTKPKSGLKIAPMMGVINTDDEPLSSDEYESSVGSPISELSRTPDVEKPKSQKMTGKASAKQKSRKMAVPSRGNWSRYNGKENTNRSQNSFEDETDTPVSSAGSSKRKLDNAENDRLFKNWGDDFAPKKPKSSTGYSKKWGNNIHASGMPKSKNDMRTTSFTTKKGAVSTTPADGNANGWERSSGFKTPSALPSSQGSVGSGSGRTFTMPSLLLDTPFEDMREKRSIKVPVLDPSETKPARRKSLKIPEAPEMEKARESSPLSDVSSTGTSRSSDAIDGHQRTCNCPVCGKEVDHDFFTEFFLVKRKDMRQQIKFCRAHKQRQAEDEYKNMGYPEIDWSCLWNRLDYHRDHLKGIIVGSKPSHFKHQLAEKIKAGKERTAREILVSGSWETLTPGYYGTRGAQVMDQYITDNLAPELRRCAPTDNIIAARGVPGYIQSVLVPELAILLIQEDMDVNESRAMEILEESRSLGEQVNEVAEDVLKLPQEMMASQMVTWEDDSDYDD